MRRLKRFAAISTGFGLAVIAAAGLAQGPRSAPNPVLYLMKAEPDTVRGTTFMRYTYGVLNQGQYSAAMFAAAPALPPCGANANSSRTWVDIFANMTNRRLNTFCALGSPTNLTGIWFTLPLDEIPPSYIYIELNDRQTNTKYRSNLADTVM